MAIVPRDTMKSIYPNYLARASLLPRFRTRCGAVAAHGVCQHTGSQVLLSPSSKSSSPKRSILEIGSPAHGKYDPFLSVYETEMRLTKLSPIIRFFQCTLHKFGIKMSNMIFQTQRNHVKTEPIVFGSSCTSRFGPTKP